MDYEDVSRQLSEDKKRETLTIKVYEGQPYYWGSLKIAGDSKEVPPEKLQKHLEKFKTGKRAITTSCKARWPPSAPICSPPATPAPRLMPKPSAAAKAAKTMSISPCA